MESQKNDRETGSKSFEKMLKINTTNICMLNCEVKGIFQNKNKRVKGLDSKCRKHGCE